MADTNKQTRFTYEEAELLLRFFTSMKVSPLMDGSSEYCDSIKSIARKIGELTEPPEKKAKTATAGE